MNEVDTKTTKTNGEAAQPWTPSRELQVSSGGLTATHESSLRSFRDEAEIHAINSALKQTGWNRKLAARLLSISYRGLLYKIRRHNITPAAGMQEAVPARGSKVE
jgi:transcriptional regulator with GAF, ATPase, and Fis domain